MNKVSISSNYDPYAKLADLYDSLSRYGDYCSFYLQWRISLSNAIQQYNIPVQVLVDLACGTGNSTIPWTRKKGWMDGDRR